MPGATSAIAECRRHRAASSVLACVVAMLAMAAAGEARAAEYCVVCAEPDATYRCVAAEVAAGTRDTGAQLLCIQDIARRAGHKTCTIQRGASAGCGGREWIVTGGVGMAPTSPAAVAPPVGAAQAPEIDVRPSADRGALPPALAGAGQGRATEPSAARGPPGDAFYPPRGGNPAGSDAPAAPRTPEAQPSPPASAAKALDKAGSAIGNAARKTWDCVSSLFSKC